MGKKERKTRRAKRKVTRKIKKQTKQATKDYKNYPKRGFNSILNDVGIDRSIFNIEQINTKCQLCLCENLIS